MMTIHLVFRPQVQSIARPPSLASWMSLFAGEESDEITAMTLSELIILLKPTFTNFIAASFYVTNLFEILDLFANFFKLCLHIDNKMRDLGIAGL